jgi:hypothetical protein
MDNCCNIERENNNSEKEGFLSYISHAKFSYIITIPFIYSLFFPAIILNIFIEVYQRISFPIYGIPIVKFSNYVKTDRVKLCHLNWFEKFNCFYCDYFNSFVAYAREVGGRTEKYWCPIKNATRREHQHKHYDDFFDYSDGGSYHENLEGVRKDICAM